MLKRWFTRESWITVFLLSFCCIMTGFLIRSEYSLEGSLLHQIPPSYITYRFFKNDSFSLLKMMWKDQPSGTLSLRVITGFKPLLIGAIQLTAPSKIHSEIECHLKPDHRVNWLHLRGGLQKIDFDLLADSAKNKIHFQLQGDGFNQTQEFAWQQPSSLTNAVPKKMIEQVSGFPLPIGLPSQEMMMNMASRWKVDAFRTRVYRLEDWMDAYLLHIYMDRDFWLKAWMSPTGELLKFESSFGFSGVNEDFFRGITEETTKKPIAQNTSLP